MQAAIVAGSPQLSTIRVCAGIYVGDLDITRDLTLIGAGDGDDPAASTILQGTGSTSVVTIAAGDVTLRRLRIAGGAGVLGGGIANSGALTLTDSTVTECTAELGGGILNDGASATLTNSTVAGNMATVGAGIYHVSAILTLIDSDVTGNTAASRGGGIFNDSGMMTIDAASRVMGNAADPGDPDSGGGIYNLFGAVTLSSAANVSGNCPDQCGGAAVPLCNDVPMPCSP